MARQTRIEHHLSDQLLIAYAAGTLPEAFSLVVASHVSLCDGCRVRLLAFEQVGGAVLERAQTAMEEDALARTMARIEAPRRPDPAPARPRGAGIFPAPLAAYVGGGPETVRWKSLGGGVRQAILRTAPGASARLLYIPAGKSVPDHGHRGTELTLVLQGAFRDDSARFGRGDIEIADEADQHQPVAEAGQDCICLAATDAPLRFNRVLPRLLQPLFNI